MGTPANEIKKRSISIITACTDDWGGSEELWGRSVPFFIAKGYQVIVYKSNVNENHPEFVKLAAQGVLFRNIVGLKPFLIRNLVKVVDKVKAKAGMNTFKTPWAKSLTAFLKNDEPIFAIISQGINFDGLDHADVCRLLDIPYILIAQKAVDFYWPSYGDRSVMTQIIQKAKAFYFVSKHNLRLTEEQFGTRLTNGHIIFNPLKIGRIQPYPSIDKGFKLACVGRLFLLDKGQDILLRIMNEQKWRDRPVSITFIGSGIDEQGLKDMAALLRVKNVSFAGHVKDMDAMWRDYHALILASRSEGLPLSMVEAMAAGRIAIISKAGGNTELIKEGETAFSGYPYEETFDEAMERAWQQRDKWEAMGKQAARDIKAVVPASPEKEFVAHVSQFIPGYNSAS
jgi:glycosyltransferase involved in cell wall biosynthesis